ncbi:MAG: OmpH family outer membrane protein [Gammaproteobacteria bacterium]|nr:OmpH family outer membrane protein [Gammaproteobacteria bacterium]MDH5652826.1 OmpH family outer membrane protein [Gammaproteobacteria bacterium]
MQQLYKHLCLISLLAVAGLLPGPVLAEEIKIGFVSMARLLKEAPQAEAARKKLENEFAPRDTKIVAMQKNLKKIEEKLGKDATVMSDAVRKKLERQIVAEKRDIKRSREEFTEDLNIRRNEELNKLQKLIYDSINGFAEDENFDIILGDSILYTSKRVDVTERVLARLKKKHKATTSENK